MAEHRAVIEQILGNLERVMSGQSANLRQILAAFLADWPDMTRSRLPRICSMTARCSAMLVAPFGCPIPLPKSIARTGCVTMLHGLVYCHFGFNQCIP